MKTTDRPFTSGLNLAMQDGLLSGGGRFFTCTFLCPHKKRLTTGAGCPMVSPPTTEKQPSLSGRVSGSAAKKGPESRAAPLLPGPSFAGYHCQISFQVCPSLSCQTSLLETPRPLSTDAAI